MSIITDILKEIPLSAVLKERLTQAEASMAALEQEKASLKAENSTLKQENENLRVDLKKATEEIQLLKSEPQPPPKLRLNLGKFPRQPI
jgi:regulator of replication initiation timing